MIGIASIFSRCKESPMTQLKYKQVPLRPQDPCVYAFN